MCFSTFKAQIENDELHKYIQHRNFNISYFILKKWPEINLFLNRGISVLDFCYGLYPDAP